VTLLAASCQVEDAGLLLNFIVGDNFPVDWGKTDSSSMESPCRLGLTAIAWGLVAGLVGLGVSLGFFILLSAALWKRYSYSLAGGSRTTTRETVNKKGPPRFSFLTKNKITPCMHASASLSLFETE
jgi:hypothetical protein